MHQKDSRSKRYHIITWNDWHAPIQVLCSKLKQLNYSDLSVFPIKYGQVNGLEYAFIDEGEGEVIFFLHGFPDHAGGWDSIIKTLSKTNRCIAPFLRGYYPTGIPEDNDYSMQTISEDVNALANGLKIEKYSVVGQDWGASIAYCMATIFPEQVQNVIALAMPHPLYFKPDLKLLFKARHIIYFMNSGKAFNRLIKNNFKYLETLYQRWSPGLDYKELKRQMVMLLSVRAYAEATLGYYWELKKAYKNKMATDKLRQVPMTKMLALVGERDGTINLNHFKNMELDNRFEVKFHKTAGHFIHREESNYCIQKISAFLGITKITKPIAA